MCVKTTPLHVASSLTADNNGAHKPPTISYMWALAFMQIEKRDLLGKKSIKNAKPDCLIFIRDNRDYITNIQIFNTKCYI